MDVGLDPAPLATEALRGDGAHLMTEGNVRFMEQYHPEAELAPRDEVARAIHSERSAGRAVFLYTRDAIGHGIIDHYPTVFAACIAAGIDPRIAPIPVAPAMHYHMGGILCDIWGQSTLNGLSVCGECASTGVHGANRLASNSLLEAVVMAARIADRLRDQNSVTAGETTGCVPIELPDEDLQALREKLAVTMAGPELMIQGDEYLNHSWQPHADGRRFEYSTPHFALAAGLNACLEDLFVPAEAGAIREECFRLQQRLLDALDPDRYRPVEFASQNRSGILAVIPRRALEEVAREAQARGLICSHRGGYLRIAPHFCTTDDDIDRAAAILNEI